MRKSIGSYLLKKKFSNLQREIQVSNLQTAASIGIVYFSDSAQKEEEIKKMVAFLEKNQIKVETIAMLPNTKEEMPVSSIKNFYLTQKELNFYRIPGSAESKKFIVKKFDILIDCNFGNHFPLRYISSLSKAKFKVGPAGGYHDKVCDLTISMKEPVTLKEYLEQTKHYLQIINQKKNEQ